MKLSMCAAVAALVAVAVGAAASAAGSGLSKSQYISKLRAVNAASAKVDNAPVAALQSKTATAADVKAKFLAMGVEHVRLGHMLATITPPPAAAKGNADLAHAEIVFGQENEAIAKKLPSTKAAILKYVQSLKPPAGGKLLDHAIAELHAAGFKI